jgi:hypothetical protein
LWSPSIPHAEARSFVSWTLLELYAIRGRRVKRGGGVESVDQALQFRERMAWWNVIRLKGHRMHKTWGETVDVLTRDERGGETDNQVVAAVCSHTEWRGRGERRIVIEVNEWC